MPYVHCTECHHEWECTCNKRGKAICKDCPKFLKCLALRDRKCDWCGGGSYILEEDTPLASMLNTFDIIELLEKMKHPESKEIVKKLKKYGTGKKKK